MFWYAEIGTSTVNIKSSWLQNARDK